jgi:hypothetical protein
VSHAGATREDPSADAVRRFARIRTGHLVEVRAPRGLTSPMRVTAFTADVVTAVREAGGRALLCADYRRASPLLPEAAGPWAHAMRETNAQILRSAVLVDPDNTMFNLQIERVVRCAGHSGHRRIFTDLLELREWMRDAATEAERQAIDAFLSRRDG